LDPLDNPEQLCNMGGMYPKRNLAVLAAVLALLVVPAGCDESREEIELTWQEVNTTASQRNGEGYARLLAPESFQHFDRIIKIALDAPYEKTQRLPVSERYDMLMMRNRMTRKELSKMDGRAWVVHAVSQGWYQESGDVAAELRLKIGNIRARGNSATADIVFEIPGRVVDKDFVITRLSFAKVEDRWLVDLRQPDPLIDWYVKREREMGHLSEDQVLLAMESEDSGKEVPRETLWDPMKK
jgi:hypothetical protein